MLESGENYLETILMLEQKNGTVRSVDVAAEQNVTKASVSRAMHILRTNGYNTFSDSNRILLTEMGREKAKWVLERHEVIAQYLMQALGVSETTALADACKLEHDLSEETFLKMKQQVL